MLAGVILSKETLFGEISSGFVAVRNEQLELGT
jgi:hypothetical protein